jgi:large subunit ribosomal protein L37Ae
MSAALLDCPKVQNPAHDTPQPGNVPNSNQPAAMACPMCGSGATYQTMDGRWGCTQCGSTWA